MRTASQQTEKCKSLSPDILFSIPQVQTWDKLRVYLVFNMLCQ